MLRYRFLQLRRLSDERRAEWSINVAVASCPLGPALRQCTGGWSFPA